MIMLVWRLLFKTEYHHLFLLCIIIQEKTAKNRDLDNLHISKYYGILLWCEGFLLCCDDVFRQRKPSKEYNKRNILHKTWFPVFVYFCFVHLRGISNILINFHH